MPFRLRSRGHRFVLLAACAAASAGCALTPLDPGVPPPREAGNSPRLDAVWQVATHNSYWVDRGTDGDLFASGVGERVLDQLLVEHARGLEIDIHKSETPHELRVYHTVPGNSLCDRFDECLGILRAFHAAVPGHGPVVVVLELKELFGSNFDEQHTIEDLDRALTTGMGPLLYRPADFLAPCDGHGISTLAECARAAEWPGVEALRGKFLFALLGNWDSVGAMATADWVKYATTGDIHDRAAFPMASSWKLDVATLPLALQDQVTQADLSAALSQSVLLQIEGLDDARAPSFLADRGVVRVDNAFSLGDQAKAVASGMQLLQSDAPWAQYDDRGPSEPARAFSPDVAEGALREPGSRLSLAPADGAWVTAVTTRDWKYGTTWRTVVSPGNDATRVQCLFAASDLGTSAKARVTLCAEKTIAPGTPDAERLTVRLTTCESGSCATVESASTGGAPGGPGELLSLQIDSGAAGSCVEARSARTAGADLAPAYVPVGERRCFSEYLVRQGISRPPVAGAATPAIFFATTREGTGIQAPELRAADLDGVFVEPADGSAAISDATKLTDLSSP